MKLIYQNIIFAVIISLMMSLILYYVPNNWEHIPLALYCIMILLVAWKIEKRTSFAISVYGITGSTMFQRWLFYITWWWIMPAVILYFSEISEAGYYAVGVFFFEAYTVLGMEAQRKQELAELNKRNN